MPNKILTYTSSSFKDTQPKYAPGTIYGSDFKFSNKTINANLGDTTYGWVEIKVSWNRDAGQPSLDISKGDRVIMHIQHPQGADCSIAEKAADGNHLFYRTDSTIDGYVEMDLTPTTDSGTSEKTFLFIANTNPEVPTEASYTINLAVGLRRDRSTHSGQFNVEYSCVKPIYQYEMGVHPYSAYDSAYAPEHTMDLYSLTPIENWGVGTRAYWDSWMTYAAPSYYFTQGPWLNSPGSSNPVVFKFGEDIDRGYGIARYYRVVKKWLFGKTRVHKKIEGPKSYYRYEGGDDRPTKLQTCCIPQMVDVGKVKRIIASENIVQPSNYKYFLAYDSNNNATAASEKAFGYYHWSKKRYYRISGIRHILEKWMQGYQKGWLAKWDPDWWTFGAIGFGAGWYAVGWLASRDKIFKGNNFLIRTFEKTWNIGAGIEDFAVKVGEAIWKFFGGSVESKAFKALGNILGGIIIGILIIKALIALFRTTIKVLKEPCLELEAAYHPNPYIKVGDPIWNEAGSSTKSYGVFTDGIQNYTQTSLAGNVATIGYQTIYSLVSPDPIEFQWHHAPKTRTGQKLANLNEIMSLLYVAGVPTNPCSPGTTYYSVAKSTTVLTNAGALESCPSGEIVSLPAGYAWSCTSQNHADSMATNYFDQIVNQALEHINERDCDLIATHGHMGVEFTHELKIETHQNYTDLYWNTASHNYTTGLDQMVGAEVFLDEQGHYPAPDGFYCNSEEFNGPNNSSLYKVFYEVSGGGVVDVWSLETSSSNTASSAVGNSPQSISTAYLDYRSDWVILESTDLSIQNWYNTWRTDPYNLVTPIDVMSYANVYKARTQDQQSDTFKMQIWNGSSWVEADEGWYGNLVGWPPIDGQYLPGDIYRYNKASTIKVGVESVCPVSSVGTPYGSRIIFRDSNGDPVEPGVTTTLELEVREAGNVLETRTIGIDGDKSSFYSAHQSVPLSANIDAYTFTDLPKTVGKRTFSYDSSLNSYCNPIDFDLVVTHQAGTNGTTVITVTSVLGLGQGTFYYTDLNNTVSGNHLASGSNSSCTAYSFTFEYKDLEYDSYNIEIIAPNGKNTRYTFTPAPNVNIFSGTTTHYANDSSTTSAVSNWTISNAPVTFDMRVFSGVYYTGQSTSVRFRVYNNVGGILLNDQTITAGPPGYGTETDTYTISTPGSYQWIVEVTGTTGPSISGYGQISLQNSLTAGSSSTNSYFVSNDGDDSGLGTLVSPFKTLSHAVSALTTQDTIYLREGSYEFDEQQITSNGFTLKAYNNENVVLDGTRPIGNLVDTNVNNGQWETFTTDIVTDANQTVNNKTLYRIKLHSSSEVWQLFYNRNEVINARWPSAQWTDESVYDFNKWGHGYYEYKNNGDIVDGSGNVLGNGQSSPYYYENGEIVDIAHSGANLYDFVAARQAIDNTFDITGSLVNLNVGSFKTYTKVVNSQSLDSVNNLITLSYDDVDLWKTKHHYYYLENKLEYLNSENEWFFDNSTKYLYVWLPNDEVPSLTNIRAKQQSYSLDITGDDVIVEDINFFGTTLQGSSANNLKVNDCNFLYASCYAHMLNQINYGTAIAPATNEVFTTQTKLSSSSNVTFDRCAFRYTDGDVLHISGGNTTIQDCYFNYIDKTVANLSSVMTTFRLMGSGNTVKNNTFRKTAASSTLNSGNAPIIEYNDMAESGYLQSDGAMIHLMVGQQPNAKIRYNWVHDTIKYGIRFDGDGDGYNGYIHHNIGWNCEGGIMAKGGWLDANGNSVGGHFVYNNTFFNSVDKNDIMVLNEQAGQNINYGSVVMNNLAETISGHRTVAEPFESWIINSNNFSPANVEDYLVDETTFDFRPLNDSSIVGAGNTTYTNSEFSPTGVDALTADIGAMSYNGSLWEAGITWNNSCLSANDYATNNKFNFSYTPSVVTPPTSTAWTPSSNSANVAWLDASDTSSYTTLGSTVTAVTDKSGTYTMSINGNPTNSNTLNGLNVFSFDGNDYMQSTTYENQVFQGDHWVIGVMRYDGTDSTKDSLWSYETNESPKRDYAVSSGASNNTWPGELDLDGLSSNRISSTIGNKLDWTGLGGLNRYQWYVVACYFNKTGNQIGMRFDGRTNSFSPVNDYDNSLSTAQELRIMRNRSSQSLEGQLAEFMTFATIPGTGGTDMSEIEKAEGYLAHKWGLTGNLPASHPYKSSAPTS